MRSLILASFVLLSGCATYHPVPLDDASTALSPVDTAALSIAASNVGRPWLAPHTVDLSEPLTLDDLAAIAVVSNPDLAAQRARAGVKDAQAFAAGLLPDPTFSFGANKVLQGPDNLLDMSGALGFDLQALRTRAVSRRFADAEASQVRLDLAWAEWQAAGQAKLQSVKIAKLAVIVENARSSRDSAGTLFDSITRAAGRGDVSGDRIEAARLALLTATEQLRTAETDLVAAESELRRQLGVTPQFTLRLAPIALPPSPPSAATLFAIAEKNRTDLAALRAGYDAQEASVRKAILEQFPTLNIALNAARDSAGAFLLGPSVDFTLPLWNRNRGAIAVERATRDALKAEYGARLFQTRADLAAAVAGLAIAYRRREDALRDLPKLERYARATARASARGDLSIETAASAAQALRDRRLVLAQAEQAVGEQSIAIELLTGTPREAWN